MILSIGYTDGIWDTIMVRIPINSSPEEIGAIIEKKTTEHLRQYNVKKTN
jgi:hypothetical protein